MLLDDTFATTYLDLETVPQGRLDIVNRARTNLLPWAGQFSPQLIEELLVAYGEQAEFVMDPFVGSGTCLVESARLGKSAWGSDVNPAATILSSVYQLVNVDQDYRKAALRSIEDSLFKSIPVLGDPQFSKDGNQIDQVSVLLDLWRNSSVGPERILVEALIVLCDFYHPGLDFNRIYKNLNRLNEIVRSLPESCQPVTVLQADARALPIEAGSVDLVVTSPPYINVHNYHQKFRRSVEALGWNVLTAASSEIGSNRQNRGNRFLTVIQYSLDMALALREMARATATGGRLILVVGRESTVRSVPFFNGRLVAELAANGVGLESERRQERQFVNRYGNKIREDILHFRTPSDFHDKEHCLEAARNIARQTLSATLRLTDVRTRQGIEEALERIDLLPPSPLVHNNSLLQVSA